jgi:arylesterase / paraoxonase
MIESMKLWLKILIGILALLVLFVARLLINSGYFTKITPYFNGQITKIDGFTGSEDLVIDRSMGLALVASSDFDFVGEGNILMLNLNETSPKPINLTTNLPFSGFHPHGLSLYESPQGEKRLFVINHRKTGNFIEIFRFTDSSLVHLESIQHPLIVSPNEIVAVGERQFYLTNDHDEPSSGWRDKKDILQIPMGNVCFYDGKNARVVDENILYANGINKSNDGKRIFVASASGQKILVYDRDPQTETLTRTDEIAINGPDNIDIDEAGNLWVACHPQLLKFLTHSKDHTQRSPSQVVKIQYQGKGTATQETVYMTDGSEISGSSVGAVYKDKLLVGSVFEKHVLLGIMAK